MRQRKLENSLLKSKFLWFPQSSHEMLWYTHFICVKSGIFSLTDPFHLVYSMLFGNLYIYFDWNGRTEIPGRVNLNTVLTICWFSVSIKANYQEDDVTDWLLWICTSLMLLIYLVFFNEAVYFNVPLLDSSRRNIFLSLLAASVVGTLSFLVLRRSHHEEEMLSEEEGQSLLSTPMM